MSDAIFEKWPHKATFWNQVPVIDPLFIMEYKCLFLSISMDFDVQYCSFVITLQLEVKAKKLFDSTVIDHSSSNLLQYRA
jgi:hypothetical protein